MEKTRPVIVVLMCTISSLALTFQDPLQASMERGEKVYQGNCTNCHMNEGQGIEGVFPPLAASDYLMEDTERSIYIVKYGQEGQITVNGVDYDGIMVPLGLSDRQVADVLNYIRNNWGNKGEIVTVEDIESVK